MANPASGTSRIGGFFHSAMGKVYGAASTVTSAASSALSSTTAAATDRLARFVVNQVALPPNLPPQPPVPEEPPLEPIEPVSDRELEPLLSSVEVENRDSGPAISETQKTLTQLLKSAQQAVSEKASAVAQKALELSHEIDQTPVDPLPAFNHAQLIRPLRVGDKTYRITELDVSQFEPTKRELSEAIVKIEDGIKFSLPYLPNDSARSDRDNKTSKEKPSGDSANGTNNLNAVRAELDTFTRNIRVLSTYRALNWSIGKNFDYKVLNKMLNGGPDESLWSIYVKSMGDKINFFQKVWARIIYFFSFSATGFIPKIIDGFTENLLTEFQTKFLKEGKQAHIDQLTGKGLRAIANILESLQRAKIKSQSNHSNLALEQKKEFEELCTKDLTELCNEASREIVDLFYKPVSFGIFTKPFNWLIRKILKNRILPQTLESIAISVPSAVNDDSKRLILGLIQAATTQLKNLQKTLEKSEPNPARYQFRDIDGYLPRISNSIMSLFAENPSILASKGIETGMKDAISLGLGLLFDSDKMVEVFSGILRFANSTFPKDQTHTNLSDLIDREMVILNDLAHDVFQGIIRNSIQKTVAFDPVPPEIEATFENLKADLIDCFKNLKLHVERMDPHVITISDGNLLIEIRHVVIEMQKLLHTISEVMNAEKNKVSDSVKTDLKVKLQPLLDQLKPFLGLILKQKDRQIEHLSYIAKMQKLQKIGEFLEEYAFYSKPTIDAPEIALEKLKRLREEFSLQPGCDILEDELNQFEEGLSALVLTKKRENLFNQLEFREDFTISQLASNTEQRKAFERKLKSEILTNFTVEDTYKILSLTQLMRGSFDSDISKRWALLKRLIVNDPVRSNVDYLLDRSFGSKIGLSEQNQIDILLDSFQPMLHQPFNLKDWKAVSIRFKDEIVRLNIPQEMKDYLINEALDQIHRFIGDDRSKGNLLNVCRVRLSHLLQKVAPSKRVEVEKLVLRFVRLKMARLNVSNLIQTLLQIFPPNETLSIKQIFSKRDKKSGDWNQLFALIHQLKFAHSTDFIKDIKSLKEQIAIEECHLKSLQEVDGQIQPVLEAIKNNQDEIFEIISSLDPLLDQFTPEISLDAPNLLRVGGLVVGTGAALAASTFLPATLATAAVSTAAASSYGIYQKDQAPLTAGAGAAGLVLGAVFGAPAAVIAGAGGFALVGDNVPKEIAKGFGDQEILPTVMKILKNVLNEAKTPEVYRAGIYSILDIFTQYNK